MSVTFSTIVTARARTSGAFLRLFNDGCDAIARHLFRRAAVKSLHELDDRALRDLGISRTQIEAAVSGLIRLNDQARM
jgi:uncharacterized protein YjiS (DUF1127 family)